MVHFNHIYTHCASAQRVFTVFIIKVKSLSEHLNRQEIKNIASIENLRKKDIF